MVNFGNLLYQGFHFRYSEPAKHNSCISEFVGLYSGQMKEWLKRIKLQENNILWAVIIVTVVIAILALVKYVRQINKPTGTITPTAAQTTITPTPSPIPLKDLPQDYIVQQEDSLWKIAQGAYGSGYNWVDIYAANKTVLGNNPDLIYPNVKITLPKVEPRTPVTTTASSYTVLRGDNLWNISAKLCNNPYAWPTLARANALPNPHLILPNQTLRVQCN